MTIKADLFYRDYPVDRDVERYVLSALALLTVEGHPAFEQLHVKDFYLGSNGFNGWLFTVLLHAQRSHAPRPIRFILQKKNRLKAARDLGVHNLPLEIAFLFRDRDNSFRGGAIRRLPEYVVRLRRVREARRQVWVAEQAYKQAWSDWDDDGQTADGD